MQPLRAALLAGFLTLASAFPALAATYTGQYVSNHDGDTITVRIKGKKEKVRLIGIDTPELAQKPWGPKARDFTRRLTQGKTLRLETDVEPRDRYGRLLAYVYVGKTFVNRALAEEGYALTLTYPPNVAHVEDFTAAVRRAREAKRGFWAEGGLAESPADYRRRIRH